MSFSIVSHFDCAVDLDGAAATATTASRPCRLLQSLLVVLVVLLLLLERGGRAAARHSTATATRTSRDGHRTARLSLFLGASRAAAPEHLQFSLGRRACAVGELAGSLERSRRSAASVGSFTYAHAQHHGWLL